MYICCIHSSSCFILLVLLFILLRNLIYFLRGLVGVGLSVSFRESYDNAEGGSCSSSNLRPPTSPLFLFLPGLPLPDSVLQWY